MSAATVAERFFVDSNLLLYAVDPREPQKRERAEAWLERLWAAGAGALSWQVLHEFYWNATRMHLKPAVARGIVEDFARWRPVDTSAGLLRQAWAWTDASGLAYWDALVLAAAERSGARYLLSEDFQAGREYGGVLAVNPFAPSSATLLASLEH